MSVSGPMAVQLGDQVRLGGQTFGVVALPQGKVVLSDVAGGVHEVALGQVLTDPSLEVVTLACPAPLPASGVLAGLPQDVVTRAQWWERHLIEVITGLPPERTPGVGPRPEYDPTTRSLRRREMAKAAELAGAGEDD